MNNKKIIRKIATITAAVMFIAILLLILQSSLKLRQQRKQAEESYHEIGRHLSALTSEIQADVETISKKIDSLPIDEKMAAELQSQYWSDNQQSNKAKKYLWMIGDDDELVFAVPSLAFEKLNKIYNTYKEKISNDYDIIDRNDFIFKTIEFYDEIKPEDFTRRYSSELTGPSNEPLPPPGSDGVPSRLQQAYNANYNNPLSVSVSSPVYSKENKIIGTLNIKADGSGYPKSAYSLDNDQVPNAFFITLVLVAIFSAIFLWFLLPSWVYLDARQRDVAYPGVWAVITLWSVVFGLTVYLITRPSQLKEFRCPACQGELNGANEYCPNCGHDLSTAFCAECWYPIRPEWAFCPHCRASLKKGIKENGHSENA